MKKEDVNDFLLKDLRVGQKFKRAEYKFLEFILISFDGITYTYRTVNEVVNNHRETTNGELKVKVIR